MAFSYKLVDLLGGDGNQLAHTMVYDQLFQENRNLHTFYGKRNDIRFLFFYEKYKKYGIMKGKCIEIVP